LERLAEGRFKVPSGRRERGSLDSAVEKEFGTCEEGKWGANGKRVKAKKRDNS